MTKTVLVLGANGNFGSHAATAFAAAGWQVRRFQRGTDMIAAAKGVDVIVNGLNPPNYHDWDRIIPATTAQVIAAGLASGATVIMPGTVYVYGDQPGPWGPQVPQRPVARKGRIRVTMEADLRAATARGLQVILLRGGDYMDPASARGIFPQVILKGLAGGKITALGRPEVRRAYAYLPDMARAAVELAEIRSTLPAYSDVPFAGYTFSINEMRDRLQVLGGRKLKIGSFPWFVLRLAAPFWEMAREMVEMRYLSSTAHSLDPAPLATLLPDFRFTPLDTVLQAHLPDSKAVGALKAA